MTVDGLAGDPAAEQMAGPSTPLNTEVILGLCDGLLQEIGRRSHLFAWLRAPDRGHRGWLVVDAYYPGHRLVVICRDAETEFEQLYSELVPQHGLRLLRLVPSGLGVERASAKLALTRLIDELAPRSEPGPAARTETQRALRALGPEDGGAQRDGPMARVAASFTRAAAPPVSRHPRLGPSQAAAAQRAARFVEARKLEPHRAAPRPAPRRPPQPNLAIAPRPAARAPLKRRPAGARPRARADTTPALELGTPFLPVALALVAVLGAEAYVGIGKLGLLDAHLLLAFAVALDACARALGTFAAMLTRSTSWSWWCVIVGSPAVAVFALFQPEGPSSADPAPLAGLVSMLAIVLIAIALVALAL